MNTQNLTDTAKALVAGNKGLLAMDESNPTCNKRFAKLDIPQTVEARRAYRELIVTTPGLGECISGAILYDETIRQQKKDGTPFLKVLTDAGIIPGIKVDTGAKDLAAHPGEKITEGLDGLRDRLAGILSNGRAFCQVAGGDCHRRWHSQPELHRGQRARAGALRRVVPGSRLGSRRRAGSAHGRRSYSGALPRGDGGSPANRFHPAQFPARAAGRHDSETQHGAAGIDLPHASIRGRGGRHHGEESMANCPRRGSGDCVFVRRPIR